MCTREKGWRRCARVSLASFRPAHSCRQGSTLGQCQSVSRALLSQQLNAWIVAPHGYAMLQKFLELNETRVSESGLPELSVELIGLLLWLLSIDPALRPSSVDEILQHPWLTGSDDSAASSSAPDVDMDTS